VLSCVSIKCTVQLEVPRNEPNATKVFSNGVLNRIYYCCCHFGMLLLELAFEMILGYVNWVLLSSYCLD
jgi:hypothetical protein